MADIKLISLLPPQPVQGIHAPAISQGAQSQTPPALPGFASGTILSGFIINRDSAGNPILRTDSGDVTFASSFFLKIGSEVVIRVDNSGGNTLAQILSVDGQPPEVAEKLSAFASQPEVIVTPGYRPLNPLVTLNATVPPGEPPTAPSPAITVFGTLIKPPQPATRGASATSLPNGTQLTLRLISLNVAIHPAAEEALLAQTPHAPSSPQVNPSYYAAYARAAGTPAPAAAAAPPLPALPQPETNSITVQAAPLPPGSPAPVAQPDLPQSVPYSASATGGEILQPQAAQPSLPPAPPLISASATPTATITPAAEPLPANAITVTQAPDAAIPAAPAAPAAAVTTPVITVAAATPLPPPVSALVASPPPQASQASPPPLPPAAAPMPVPLPPAEPPVASMVTSAVTSVSGDNLLAGQIIIATAASNAPSGEALLHTPAGLIRLQPGTVVPPGSTLTLQIVQTTPPSFSTLTSVLDPAQPLPAEPAPLKELAQQWTSLQQVVALLAQRFALMGLDYLPVGLPGVPAETPTPGQATLVPHSLSTGLLLFLASLRGGDFRNWLGADHVQWLEDEGHGSLVRRAEKEFSALWQNYAEAKPGQWQTLFFPVAVENHVQQTRLFLKRDRRQGNAQAEKPSEDTRFIIEVDLSHLGEMQIDGFVRKQEKDLHFDMVIRSLAPIPKEFQEDILRIYTETGALTGYSGSLVFQPVKEFPVNPIEDSLAAQGAIVA